MEERFLEFVANLFDVDASAINLDTAYGTIPEWDSLMQLRLVGELEDEFGADIPIDAVAELKTLRDFFKYMED